jgi:hypothetical protein
VLVSAEAPGTASPEIDAIAPATMTVRTTDFNFHPFLSEAFALTSNVVTRPNLATGL